MGRGGGGGGGRRRIAGGGGAKPPKKTDQQILDEFQAQWDAEFAQYHGGITPKEWSGLERYTGYEAYDINRALYEGKGMTPEMREWIKDIDSGLEKLPTYEGTGYRGLSFGSAAEAKAFADQFEVGQGTRMKAYTSIAKDTQSYSYDTYTKPHQVQMEFKSKKGRDTTGETGGPKLNPSEREVVFARGSRFKVTSKRVGSGGQTIIHLEEI